MRRKILVVEDDLDQLKLLRLVLKTAGFAVGTATHGTDALIKTRSLCPDLILLDLMLPGLNGFDVCETLRKDPATASTPIIMLTGLSSQFGRFAGMESGATDFFMKPFNPDQLVSRVKELLGPATAHASPLHRSKAGSGRSHSHPKRLLVPTIS